MASGRAMCAPHLIPSGLHAACARQVRSLFGTNSYKLFTLDKLLSRMAKHLQLMITGARRSLIPNPPSCKP